MSGGRLEAPLTIFAPSGAGIGAGAQHSQSVHSWLGNVPGWVVVTATRPYHAKGLLKSAIRDDNPVFFLRYKTLSETKGEVPEEDNMLPLGEAAVEKEGEDVTIVATQVMFHRATEATADLDVDAGSSTLGRLHLLIPKPLPRALRRLENCLLSTKLSNDMEHRVTLLTKLSRTISSASMPHQRQSV